MDLNIQAQWLNDSIKSKLFKEAQQLYHEEVWYFQTFSSCKSYFILKENSRCIHYLTQRKSTCKSKLTNYAKQIPLDTSLTYCFSAERYHSFCKFLYFITLFEQSLNLLFYCPKKCWIHITVYPLQCYNNGTFIETIFFFPNVWAIFVIKKEITLQFLGGTPGFNVWNHSKFMHDQHGAFPPSHIFDDVPTNLLF